MPTAASASLAPTGLGAVAKRDAAPSGEAAGDGAPRAPDRDGPGVSDAPPPEPAGAAEAKSALPAAANGPRRPTRYGLAIDFEERPESEQLGRLVESTVLVNAAHPAYLRALASRAEGYHAALAVAMALGAVAVEPAGAHTFVTRFLARWGAAVGRGRGRRQPPGRERS